jgi:hypothetical protein
MEQAAANNTAKAPVLTTRAVRGLAMYVNRSGVLATSNTALSRVPTAEDVNGLAKAVSQALLLLVGFAPISTLLKLARTCRAVSGPLQAANPTTELIPQAPPPALVRTTLSPVVTFQAVSGLGSHASPLTVTLHARISIPPPRAPILRAAIGQAAPVDPQQGDTLLGLATSNTLCNHVHTCLVAIGLEALANLLLQAVIHRAALAASSTAPSLARPPALAAIGLAVPANLP